MFILRNYNILTGNPSTAIVTDVGASPGRH